MKYRLKTHEELLATGYVQTPGDQYVHHYYPRVKEEMRLHSSYFSDELFQMIFKRSERSNKSLNIDGYKYSSHHFTIKE